MRPCINLITPDNVIAGDENAHYATCICVAVAERLLLTRYIAFPQITSFDSLCVLMRSGTGQICAKWQQRCGLDHALRQHESPCCPDPFFEVDGPMMLEEARWRRRCRAECPW